MDVGSIWIKLGLDPSGLKNGLTEAKGAVTEWKGSLENSALSMQSWGQTVATVGMGAVAEFTAVGAAIMEVTNSAASFGSEIEDSAYKIGVTNEQMLRLRAAGAAVDVPLENITQSAKILAMRLGDSGAAGETLRARLQELGISTVDQNGNLRDQVDIYWDVITAIHNTEDPMARAALANDTLGRSWGNVVPLIRKADEAKAAYTNSASPFSDDELNKMDEYNDKLSTTKAKWDDIVNVLGSRLIPVADVATSAIAGFIDTENRGLDNIHASLMNLKAFIANPMGGDTQWTTADDLKKKWDVINANNARGASTTPDTAGAAAKAAADLKAQEALEKETTDALTQSWKDYQSALQGVSDETKKLQDINTNFDRQLSVLDPHNVQAARDLLQRREWAETDQVNAIKTAQTKVSETTVEFNSIKSGTPLDQIRGTDQYTAAKAKSTESIAPITISGNIYLQGDKSFEKYLQTLQTKSGVPQR